MIRNIDQARAAIQAVEDPVEKAFLEVAFKTAFVDLRAGVTKPDFDYLVFVEVVQALYRKKDLLRDILEGRALERRWWDDE